MTRPWVPSDRPIPRCDFIAEGEGSRLTLRFRVVRAGERWETGRVISSCECARQQKVHGGGGTPGMGPQSGRDVGDSAAAEQI
jgi:hypothetical protein